MASNPFDVPLAKRKRGRPPLARPAVEEIKPVVEPEYIPEPEPEPFLPVAEPDLTLPTPPPPPPPPEEEKRGDPKERVLGKTGDTFTLEEIEYIKEHLKQFSREVDGDPRSIAIINNAIYADILVQRLDAEMERLERNRKTDPDVDKKITPLYKRRSQLWDDYCDNLEKLGAMPKDRKNTARDDALSEVYAKYIAELDRRRANNWPLGRPSDAAIALANELGDRGPAKVPVRPEILKSDILPDEQRKDFVDAKESTGEPA